MERHLTAASGATLPLLCALLGEPLATSRVPDNPPRVPDCPPGDVLSGPRENARPVKRTTH
ncbi:hypothetical protein [Vitiosangium sp. GDMCC 1.1324]|uniref:hypothetical protein n=1 Tax=Vitiosangium sp. (strain GDMCC 1.1324) TaxID=2138576 RepID=UPI0011B78513|nr:hypothetical protein [Vitiosangium sp. GDMCC 1.1324]